jgi:hypothetical protein
MSIELEDDLVCARLRDWRQRTLDRDELPEILARLCTWRPANLELSIKYRRDWLVILVQDSQAHGMAVVRLSPLHQES